MWMWPDARVAGLYMLRHFDISVMQQQKRVDLRHPLRGEGLSYGHPSHIDRFCK